MAAVGGPITTGSHPLALWPGIHGWWGRMYNEHVPEWTALCDQEMSTQNYEKDTQIIGFGLAQVKQETASTNYVSEVQGFSSIWTHVEYSLGYIVSQVELEDDLYESVSKTRSRALAFAFNQTKENVVANVYNNAFTAGFIGGDGVSLCNTAHPNTSGGTWSNMLAVGADLWHMNWTSQHIGGGTKLGIPGGPPLARIPLDGEVFALDVAQPAQLCPKRLPSVTSRVIEAGHRTRSDDNRNPVLLRRFLRPARSWCGREQQTDRQIAPPHSMTSSASASNEGGKVRPRALAAFRLITNSNLVG